MLGMKLNGGEPKDGGKGRMASEALAGCQAEEGALK